MKDNTASTPLKNDDENTGDNDDGASNSNSDLLVLDMVGDDDDDDLLDMSDSNSDLLLQSDALLSMGDVVPDLQNDLVTASTDPQDDAVPQLTYRDMVQDRHLPSRLSDSDGRNTMWL